MGTQLTMTTVRLEDELLRAIDAEARRSGMTRASVIREALLRWLEDRRVAQAAERDHAGYERQPIGDCEFASVLRAQTRPT